MPVELDGRTIHLLFPANFTADGVGDVRTSYYGMVDDGGGFMRGCASGIPSRYASGPAGAVSMLGSGSRRGLFGVSALSDARPASFGRGASFPRAAGARSEIW